MKKLFFVVVVYVLSSLFAFPVLAVPISSVSSPDKDYKWPIVSDSSKIKVFMDGELISEDAINIDGRVYIEENVNKIIFGTDISYNESNSIVITKNGKSLNLFFGEDQAILDDRPLDIGYVGSIQYNSKSYFSIRVIAESLGLHVGWDEIAKTVCIVSPEHLYKVAGILGSAFSNVDLSRKISISGAFNLRIETTNERGAALMKSGNDFGLDIDFDAEFVHFIVKSNINTDYDESSYAQNVKSNLYLDGDTLYVGDGRGYYKTDTGSDSASFNDFLESFADSQTNIRKYPLTLALKLQNSDFCDRLAYIKINDDTDGNIVLICSIPTNYLTDSLCYLVTYVNDTNTDTDLDMSDSYDETYFSDYIINKPSEFKAVFNGKTGDLMSLRADMDIVAKHGLTDSLRAVLDFGVPEITMGADFESIVPDEVKQKASEAVNPLLGDYFIISPFTD